MSAITLAELRFGVAKSAQAKRAQSNLRVLRSKVAVLPFDEEATTRYGELRALLEQRGTPIGPLDTLIAAHALSTVASSRPTTRASSARAGVKVEDWLAE